MDHCPKCDQMLTRLSILALCLRKIAVLFHRQFNHTTMDWTRCDKPVCNIIYKALNDSEFTASEIKELR